MNSIVIYTIIPALSVHILKKRFLDLTSQLQTSQIYIHKLPHCQIHHEKSVNGLGYRKCMWELSKPSFWELFSGYVYRQHIVPHNINASLHFA
jgi:hypothetical protein